MTPSRTREGARGEPSPRDPAPSVRPISRQTLAAMTVDALRDSILRGRFPEGQPLRQDKIAAQLGVSRIPVREALRQLESEGLVTFAPHKGAVVSLLSLGEIEELFALRALIESDLVRRAVPRMTREDDARTAEVLERYERAIRGGESSEWEERNWQFHSTLCLAADRPFTLAFVRKLHQQSDRYQRMHLTFARGEIGTRKAHRAIAAAAKRRDARLAARLMRDHILVAGTEIVTVIASYREPEQTRRRARS